MKTLKKIDDAIAKVERLALFLLLVLMVLLVFGEVAVRSVAKQSISGGSEYARLFMVWAGFIGASLAAHDGKHLAVTFPYPEKYKRYIYVIRFLVTLAFMVLIAVFGWEYWSFKRKIPTTNGFFETSWLFLSIPVTFTLMSVRYMLLTVRGAMGDYEDPKEQTH